MKTYFRNGARGYMYWNIALEQGSKSTWGWSQNSLVVVEAAAGTFHYTPDFYLLKHLTHFVDVGASFVPSTGTCDNVLAFRNADGSVALLMRNELPHAQLVQVQIGSEAFAVELPPDSVSTVTVV
jgi:glucosylceramidase